MEYNCVIKPESESLMINADGVAFNFCGVYVNHYHELNSIGSYSLLVAKTGLKVFVKTKNVITV